MKDFKSIFGLSFKRFFRPGKSLIIIGLILLTILIVINGFSEYQKSLEKGQQFQKLDAAKAESLTNYLYYSIFGVKFFCVPSSLGKFLDSKKVTVELEGRVDSITSLEITINGKSGAIFEEPQSSPFRYTFVTLFLGNLFVLFIGVNFSRDKEFLKFISSQCGPFKVFACRVLSKIFFFTLILLCLFAVILLVFYLFGAAPSSSDISCLAGYFMVTWTMIVSFFFAGVTIGSIRKREYAVYTLLAIWFIAIFLVPGLLNSYISKQAEDITASYQVEYEQLKIVKAFERKAKEMYGKYDGNKVEIGRKVAEYYYNEVYPQIEALENRFKNEISALIQKKRDLSIWFPTTFFQLTGNTVSGYGHQNYLKFYTFLQEKKKAFLRFWIDRVYYNDPKDLVSFTNENNSNLFHSSAALPGNFGAGVLVNLFYSFILFAVSYFRYRRALFPAWKETGSEDQLKIQLFNDEKITVNAYQNRIAPQIVNTFFGAVKTFNAEIQIEETPIVTKKKKEFLYLPHPRHLPEDIKPIELFTYFKHTWKLTAGEFRELKNTVEDNHLHNRFGKLGTMVKAHILLSLVELGKSPVYILDDFAANLDMDDRSQLARRIDGFYKKDSLFININTKKDKWFNADSTVSIGRVDSKYKTLKPSRPSLNGKEKK